MNTKQQWVFIISIVLLLGLSTASVWWFFTRNSEMSQKSLPAGENAASVETAPTPSPEVAANLELTAASEATDSASERRLNQLETTVADLESELEELSQTVGQLQQNQSVSSGASANFNTETLYLGSGSTTNRDWTDTGQEVRIDSADYPSGVKALFEAGLSTDGGEVWARLVNQTTGAIITISEVWHNGSTTKWQQSPTFQLHPGSNIYEVQLRSSSGETARLDGARVVIKD
jgi:TolA-binding protein